MTMLGAGGAAKSIFGTAIFGRRQSDFLSLFVQFLLKKQDLT